MSKSQEELETEIYNSLGRMGINHSPRGRPNTSSRGNRTGRGGAIPRNGNYQLRSNSGVISPIGDGGANANAPPNISRNNTPPVVPPPVDLDNPNFVPLGSRTLDNQPPPASGSDPLMVLTSPSQTQAGNQNQTAPTGGFEAGLVSTNAGGQDPINRLDNLYSEFSRDRTEDMRVLFNNFTDLLIFADEVRNGQTTRDEKVKAMVKLSSKGSEYVEKIYEALGQFSGQPYTHFEEKIQNLERINIGLIQEITRQLGEEHDRRRNDRNRRRFAGNSAITEKEVRNEERMTRLVEGLNQPGLGFDRLESNLDHLGAASLPPTRKSGYGGNPGKATQKSVRYLSDVGENRRTNLGRNPRRNANPNGNYSLGGEIANYGGQTSIPASSPAKEPDEDEYRHYDDQNYFRNNRYNDQYYNDQMNYQNFGQGQVYPGQNGQYQPPIRSSYEKSSYETPAHVAEYESYLNLSPPFNQVPIVSGKGIRLFEFAKSNESLILKDGSSEEYLWFLKRFKAAVHELRIPVSFKIDVLKNGLKSVVGLHTPIMNETVEEYGRILEQMHARFGNPNRLLGDFQRRFNALRDVAKDDVEGLNKFCKNLVDLKAVLQHEGKFELFDTGERAETLIACLDDEAYRDLSEFYGRSDETPDVNTIQQWAQSRLAATCSVQNRRKIVSTYYNRGGYKRTPPGMQENGESRTFKSETKNEIEDSGTFSDWDSGESDEEKVRSNKVKAKFEPRCFLKCNERHYIEECPKFLEFDSNGRRDFLEDNKHCILCFRRGHVPRSCKFKDKIKCDVEDCSKKHPSLIHGSIPRRFRKSEPNKFRSKRLEDPKEDKKKEENRPENDKVKENSQPKVLGNNVHGNRKVSLLYVPAIIRKPGTKEMLKVNALLDTGSDSTFISDRLSEKLGIPGFAEKITMETPSGTSSHQSEVCQVVIESYDGKVSKSSYARVLPYFMGSGKTQDWNVIKENWPHLKNVNFPKLEGYYGNEVDALIGWDNADLITPLDMIKGVPEDGPSAIKTVFGWAGSGPISSSEKESPDAQIYKVNIAQPYSKNPVGLSAEDEVIDLVKNSWMANEFDILPEKDLENKKILETLKQRYKVEDKRATVPALWKDGTRPWNMPNNRRMAEKRLRTFQKTMAENPAHKKHVQEMFERFKKEGIIVPIDESKLIPGKHSYLSYFPVMREASASTPIRIVYDAAAECQGVCLNDFIAAGPNVTNTVVSSLIKYRLNKVAFAADIKEMFHQVQLEDKDKYYHLILVEDPDGVVRTYAFARHCFGNRGSPTAATVTAQYNAYLAREEFPKAADIIINSSIMDDCLGSVGTAEEALEVIHNLQEIFGRISMKLHKITSSSKEVLASLNEELRSKSVKTISFDKDESGILMEETKTLGLIWSGETDSFRFTLNALEKIKPPWTKRKLIKFYAALYDPIGWLLPVIMRGRSIFQKTWIEKLNWDDEVTPEIRKEWIEWLEDLKINLKRMTFDRCLISVAPEKIVEDQSVHIFSDASESGYGSVAYLKTKYTDLTFTVKMIYAKARIKPIKRITLQRLELNAAGISVLVMKEVKDAAKIPAGKFRFYTDSRNVLCWIRRPSRSLDVYVGNRVSVIQQNTQIADWFYVPSELNPADILSRGCSTSELMEEELWLNGPEFLVDESKFPKQLENLPSSEDLEREENPFPVRLNAVITNNDFWAKFSYWERLLRFTKVCLRFLENVRDKELQREVNRILISDKELRSKPEYERDVEVEWSEAEILEARNRLFKMAQMESFPKLYKMLEKGKRVPPKHPMAPFNPELCEDGLIRCNARLKGSALKMEQKFPILLPKDHHTVKVYVEFVHRRGLHHAGGPGTLASQLEGIWIIRGRRMIAKIVKDCITCKRVANHRYGQIMAPLPSFRTFEESDKKESHFKPWKNIGVDCIGPFSSIDDDFVKTLTDEDFRMRPKDFIGMLKQNNALKKRWVVLFTCAKIRACHFEVLEDLSTDALMLAFERYVATRGRPKLIISDNGTNLNGMHNRLTEIWNDEKYREFRREYPEVKWEWNPPGAPHTGGFFERLVAEFKKCYYRLMKRRFLTLRELYTVCKKAEAIMNNRPIAYKYESPSDLILTPNHFMIAQQYRQLAPIPDAWPLSDRWLFIQDAVDTMWKEFVKTILPTLNRIPKWREKVKSVKVDDIVIILDERKPSGQWPTGRIISTTKTQSDGLVRLVDIRLPNDDVITRTVNRIMPLDVEEADTEGDNPQEATSEVPSIEVSIGLAEETNEDPMNEPESQIF